MRITKEIAYPILQKLTTTLHYNINIMDEQGVIIASVDPSRIDSVHQGAIQVLEKRTAIIITEREAGKFSGTKEGVNLPVEFMGLIDILRITADILLLMVDILKVMIDIPHQTVDIAQKHLTWSLIN